MYEETPKNVTEEIQNKQNTKERIKKEFMGLVARVEQKKMSLNNYFLQFNTSGSDTLSYEQFKELVGKIGLNLSDK